jgi:hypothetical protein
VLLNAVRASVKATKGTRIHDLIASVAGLSVENGADMLAIGHLIAKLESSRVLDKEDRPDASRHLRAYMTTGPVTCLPEHAPDPLDTATGDDGHFDFGGDDDSPKVVH